MSRSDNVRPILRWVGGKQFLLQQLLGYCPPDVFDRRYHEPFLGAASLFLALRPKIAFLSDANAHLINAYKEICTNTSEVAQLLLRMATKDSVSFYYSTRKKYNDGGLSTTQAARFLYLNRTCFNGIFRVNKQGEYNVPYGYKKTPRFPSKKELRTLAEVLRHAKLINEDYLMALKRVKKGDFIYLDPPYPPLNGTSNFARYTKDHFGMEHQQQLAARVHELDRMRCLFMVTNADTKLVRSLYRDFKVHRLAATRFVSCKAIKHQVHELVITNY